MYEIKQYYYFSASSIIFIRKSIFSITLISKKIFLSDIKNVVKITSFFYVSDRNTSNSGTGLR